MSVPHPNAALPGHPPDEPKRPSRRNDSWWPEVVAVVLVLSSSTVLLATGHSLYDTLLGASGMALTGNEVARRSIVDANPVPTVIVGSAVAAFGATLIVLGFSFSKAVTAAGTAGLIAGKVADRMFGIPRAGREV